MLLDVYGALQDRFGRVLGQNCKFCTTDPKKLAISEIISLIAKFTEPAQMNFAYG
jgi:transcription termination factor NusB